MAQFPLEMGRKKKTSNALAVQVDAEGKIKYDAIARQGQGKDKVYRQLKNVSVYNLKNINCRLNYNSSLILSEDGSLGQNDKSRHTLR